ncbi:DNA polymerase [Pseudonocardia spinosispora]|uniref:DNA polymerase n=1 Tax=Pseudonocardia spinosispora TaxID=103441 RepID=UPI00042293F5|nr:DNA polymerase [Pseudonocardia spinosispora]
MTLCEVVRAGRAVGEDDGVTESVVRSADELFARMEEQGARRGQALALVVVDGAGLGMAVPGAAWALAAASPVAVVERIESWLRPRWVWWSQRTPAALVAAGLRPATCWDVGAVHRILFGGGRGDAAAVWAALHDLDEYSIPGMGQLDLLTPGGEDGADLADPVRPDGHLRPEWVSGGWTRESSRWARWAAIALAAHALQQQRLSRPLSGGDPSATARSESAVELLCAELAADGLPVQRRGAEQLLASLLGPRPSDQVQAREQQERRDDVVRRLVPDGDMIDLRNPAQVRRMLASVGIDAPDTRAWRLEPMVELHPVVPALLQWRKAERLATTYGYRWLDEHVGTDGRLRGRWSSSDGAAGRMTAQAGLHNMPAELRPAVVAEPGHVLVRADLGQIEPRVLAAVSKDRALVTATRDEDLYSPVAERLRVERPVAKVAVLAAMYGQTSGTAGEALRGLESAYPTAMRFLRKASDQGRAGKDVRTYGGRLVRIGALPEGLDETTRRMVAAARGRFARNAVVQGAAAELFKVWAVTIRARCAPLGGRIVLCLHDELLVHVPEEHGETVADLLRTCLDETGRAWFPGSGVRFVADVHVVRQWSEAKAAMTTSAGD